MIARGAAVEGWDSGNSNGWAGGLGTVISTVESGGHPNGYLSGQNDNLIMIMSSLSPFAENYSTGGF